MAAGYGVGSSRNREKFAYDVFLSFRGEDVRKSFVDHLRAALDQKGITAFYDDTCLERGDEIKSKLYEAIEKSKMAIVTFSPRYATSRWCLDELVKVMECRSRGLTAFLPVFYEVDPTHVRHQSGPFKEAFRKHEVKHGVQQVNKWRQAMESAANLVGFCLQNQANGYEVQFIKLIIKEVVRRLDARQLDVPKYMIGAESELVLRISRWLRNESLEVEVGIIHGPGGVGKTTIAKVVYNGNYGRFESSSFLANVRAAYMKDIEFICLQEQLIRNVTGDRKIKIDSISDGRQKIKKVIGTKKILVVLDDVDEVEFGKMFDCPDWFFPGSKILITSQNRNFLISDKSIARFEGFLLDEEESVNLFAYHAFGQAHPPQDYRDISMKFIKYCGGLPLALEVVASSLRSVRFEKWELHYAKLSDYLDENVLNVLMLSYDSLPDSAVKDLFLHIVFFMVGRKKEYVLKILDGCGLHGEIGLDILIGKCLVSVDNRSDTLVMHQLIQHMGYEVVRQKPPIELGCRSRIVGQKDAYEVLRKKTGTSTIKGLHLHLPNPHDDDISSDEICIDYSAKRMRTTYIPMHSSRLVSLHFKPIKTDAFTKMSNLDLLLLDNVQLHGGFEDFPKGIKWLLWLGCPLKEIPADFEFDELVILDMQKSCLVHAWNCLKYVGALKVLNLNYSHQLRCTPDLSSAHKLEQLSCKDCKSLVEVHESIGKLENLTYLNMEGCVRLVTWPESMGNLTKLTSFSVKGLNQVESSADFLESNLDIIIPVGPTSQLPFKIFLPSLKKLSLSNCGISQDDVMELISCAPSLKSLDLSNNQIRVTSDMNRRPCLKLKELRLANCGISRVDDLELVSLAPSLISLDLTNNPICELGTMNRDSYLKLQFLNLKNCPNLQSISNIFDSCVLWVEHCYSLKRISYYTEKWRHLIEGNDCQKLVEMEHGVCGTDVIEWTNDQMMADQARYLGFPYLNTFTHRVFGRGINQAGMDMAVLHGNHMAKWFLTTENFRGGSARYRVPASHPTELPIRALNVGILNGYDTAYGIENVTRMWIWTYGTPWWLLGYEARDVVDDEDITWLFHWCVTEHRQIRPGDELVIHSQTNNGTLGVKVIYEEEHMHGEGAENDEGKYHGTREKSVDSTSSNQKEKEDDNHGSAATDVAVWYNNTFRSHDLSCYEVEQENSCDATGAYVRQYFINFPLRSANKSPFS
uniref:TIR domain-containing protein n=1 Tax=Kalanchoe fedtschenkoi TaxID=63787 RepID=A0A7N0V5E4_KALFE